MKNIWKYILAGLVVAFACFCCTIWFAETFKGLKLERGFILGIGIFLSFEMVVLTGIIVSKIDKNKPSDKEE